VTNAPELFLKLAHESRTVTRREAGADGVWVTHSRFAR
jgi:hypothetical protein